MNRRTFLRSIATVCGAAVVCPGELVKSPVRHLWMRGKDGSYIEGEETRWSKYHAGPPKPLPAELFNEFEREFWNTKFKSPLMPRTK